MKTKIGLILVVLGMLFQSLNADITTGLVAYYPFNGNANDESGNGNNGTVNGATLTTDRFGNANSAYSFGINNANIQIPNSVLNSLAQSTISAWVYWDGNTPSIIMAKQHNGYDSYCIFGIGMYSSADGQPTIGETGRVYFRAKNYSELLTSSALLEKGKWTHLLVTLGQDAKLFINGSFDKVATGSNFSIPTDLSSTSSNLGAWFWEGKYKGAMNGKLDDIRIYNRALSEAEVKTLYDSEKPPVSGLVAYYPFNGNANDESGNGNNGTVNGATFVAGKINNCLQFTNSGSENNVSIPHSASLDLADNMTFSMWINASSSQMYYPTLLSKEFGSVDIGIKH